MSADPETQVCDAIRDALEVDPEMTEGAAVAAWSSAEWPRHGDVLLGMVESEGAEFQTEIVAVAATPSDGRWTVTAQYRWWAW